MRVVFRTALEFRSGGESRRSSTRGYQCVYFAAGCVCLACMVYGKLAALSFIHQIGTWYSETMSDERESNPLSFKWRTKRAYTADNDEASSDGGVS
jgi:hypothetical protein